MIDPGRAMLTVPVRSHRRDAVGLCASRGSRTVDVGAGRADGLLVVADEIGGHRTGWLGARLGGAHDPYGDR
jgi:hypothetical protein